MAYNPNNPNGQATKANSAPVVIASDDDLQGKLGIVTETAPGTDTASSGLNGRLQRIAQRLTSLIALLPPALVGGRLDVNLGAAPATVTATLAVGSNNIGDVDVLTLPALPAGTNLIGSVNAQLDASTMRDGAGTALTPKFAIIDAATSGDNTLVAAVASKKIRVVALYLVAAGTVTVRFESGAGGTALSGQMNLVANTGFALPFSPVGWMETAVNTLLNLELSAAVSVDGSLVYVEV